MARTASCLINFHEPGPGRGAHAAHSTLLHRILEISAAAAMPMESLVMLRRERERRETSGEPHVLQLESSIELTSSRRTPPRALALK